MLKIQHSITRPMVLILILVLVLSSSGMEVIQAGASVNSQTNLPPIATIDQSIDTTNFPVKGKFIVHFNSLMNSESVNEPVYFVPPIEGMSQWSNGNKTVSFTPTTPFIAGEDYLVFLDANLESTEGLTFDQQPQWSIRIESGPSVVKQLPPSGILTKRTQEITLKFDRPMDKKKTGSALSIQPEVPFTTAWTDDFTMKVFVSEQFTPGNSYTVTLAGQDSKTSAMDAGGIPLEEDYSFSYLFPEFEFQVELMEDGRVSVKSNYPLAKSKDTAVFSFKPQLVGTWTWPSGISAIFTPKEAIPYGVDYSLVVDRSLIEKDNLPTPTGNLEFSAPPPIEFYYRTETADDYVDPDYSPFEFIFYTPMDHKSVEKSFSVTPSVGGQIDWRTDSKGHEIFSFHPDQLLSPEATYIFQFTKVAKDRRGKAIIVDPFTKIFNVARWYQPPVSFGDYGDNIQVVDINGPRNVQFGLISSDKSIQFELVPYELITFAGLYNQYGNRRYYSSAAEFIPTEEVKLIAKWRYAGSTETAAQTSIPGNVPPGLYILNLRYGSKLYDQLFLVLTENTITVKNSGNDLLIWVNDINDEIIKEAEIRLYSTRGEILRQGKIDESGVYRTTIPDGYTPSLISAKVKDSDGNLDITVAGLTRTWLSDWGWGGWSDNDGNISDDQLIYSYTDRPIYKPGQIVNIKTIVRLDNDARYENIPDGTEVKVQIHDPDGNLLDEYLLRTNSYGSVNSFYKLSDEAASGGYYIEAIVNGESSLQTFKVEDYRKPDFQVTITPVNPDMGNNFVAGDQFQLEVDTRYFFGEPVANASLKINKYQIRGWYSYWWVEADDVDIWDQNNDAFYARSEKTFTDDSGKALIIIRTKGLDEYDVFYNWKNSLKYQKFAIEVTANDGSNQTVSKTYTFTVNSASEKLSLDTGGYFRQPGEPFLVSARVEDLSGNPVANRSMVLKVLKWSQAAGDYKELNTSYTLLSDDRGNALQELALDKGFYKFILTGKDIKGNPMEYEQWAYVFKTRDDWYSRHNDEIAIVSDSQSYNPYQTAKFLVESTFSGPAMLTIERGHVIHHKEVELTAPVTEVELPIISAYAPNIFVTINAYEPADLTTRDASEYDYEYWMTNRPDSHLRVASTEVQVESQEKILQVFITTDKEIYLPGEKVNATLTVKDWQGKPVTAEVSLAMVDEAIFSLSDELAPKIQKAFYGRRNHAVDTYDSMSPYREIYIGGRGGGGGGGFDPGAELRSDFPDTAAWFPALRTDRNGVATVAIDLPDNVTSWRLSAKAITLDHKVGEGIDNFETKKELLVQPILPRVLTTGDTATLSAMIHNYGQERQKVVVSLEAPGLSIKDSAKKTIIVEPGKVKPVTWKVEVTGTQTTQVTISAEPESGTVDAIRLDIPIQAKVTMDVQNLSGDFKGGKQLIFQVPVILPEESSITLSISRSPQNTILDGLDYLTGFPYGCVEQTMSRGLPNGVVGRASVKLGLGGIHLQEQVRPYVKASIQKLYSLQHGDGGWGWWEDDNSDDYQTAWVIFGLSILSETGEPVESQVIEKGVEYLIGYEGGGLAEMDPRTRAFALYSMAMAGKGDIQATLELVTDPKASLDPFSSFALALALHRMGEIAQAKAILDRMEEIAVRKGDKVFWLQQAGDGEYHQKNMSSTVRTTALGLSAYVTIDPKNPLIPGIARYVISERTANRGWGTTNETSFAILALTDYLLQLQKQTGVTPYQAELNGSLLSEGNLTADQPYVKLEIPIDKVNQGVNSVSLSAQSETLVYYDLTTRLAIPRDEFDAAGVVKIERKYLDQKTKQPLDSVKVGDLVLVQLRVDYPEDVSYVIIEDHLPGGLEALNERLNTVSKIDYGDGYYEETYSWQDLGYNKKDVFGDRVTFFITEMGDGIKIITYVARATVPGTFTALPAESYAMYDPDIWGRSSSDVVTVDNK